MKLKSFIQIIAVSGIALTIAGLESCKDAQSPGYEYMPDMYRSPAVETYVDYNALDSLSARKPAKGSIPRGHHPFMYENTLEGYEAAGRELKIPFEVNEKVLAEGQELFLIFCAHCHGAKGDGKGSITNAIYGAVPSYADNTPNRRGNRSMSQLAAGNIYHTIYYGLNAMGPHSTLIPEMDRWKIVAYVQTLQGNKNEADANATAEVTEATDKK